MGFFIDSNANEELDLFDKIFKKLKFQKINSDSIEYPLTSATIDMEFEFNRSFKLFDFEKKTNNISFSEYNALKFYIKNKPFKIIDCDKIKIQMKTSKAETQYNPMILELSFNQ